MVAVSVACGPDSCLDLLSLVPCQGPETHYKYWHDFAQYVGQVRGWMPKNQRDDPTKKRTKGTEGQMNDRKDRCRTEEGQKVQQALGKAEEL